MDDYIWGTGRRKTAVARVRIRRGNGTFLINNRTVEEYFPTVALQNAVQEPLRITKTVKKYDIFVNVKGGGVSGQAGAVIHGLARALAKADESLTPELRAYGFLTRDPRMVERKKYGRRGARRSFQFSKR